MPRCEKSVRLFAAQFEHVFTRAGSFPSKWNVQDHVGVKKHPHCLFHMLRDNVLQPGVAVGIGNRGLPRPPLGKLACRPTRAALLCGSIQGERDHIVIGLSDDERVAGPQAK